MDSLSTRTLSKDQIDAIDGSVCEIMTVFEGLSAMLYSIDYRAESISKGSPHDAEVNDIVALARLCKAEIGRAMQSAHTIVDSIARPA